MYVIRKLIFHFCSLIIYNFSSTRMEVANTIKVQVVLDIHVQDFIKDVPLKPNKGRKMKSKCKKGSKVKKNYSKQFKETKFQNPDDHYVTVPIYSEYHPDGISGYYHISTLDDNWENEVQELESRAYSQN